MQLSAAYGEKLFDIQNWGATEKTSKMLWGMVEAVAKPFQTFNKVNDFKLPDSHHLDVNVNLSVKYGIFETIVGIGVYNVYNHFNVSSVYMGYDGHKAVMKGICPFPIMPSISVTQKF